MITLAEPLVPVPVERIAAYPDSFGRGDATCIWMARFPSTRSDEVQAFITRTAGDPQCVADCLASSYCGELLAKLREDPAFGGHPVTLLKMGERYYPGGSGHHRICIAKRAGLQLLMARVYEIPADDPHYTFLAPVGEIQTHQARLQLRRDAAYEGTALYLAQVAPLPSEHAWLPVTYVQADPDVTHGQWSRPWADHLDRLPSMPAPIEIRAWRSQTRAFGLIRKDMLYSEVRLEPPTGRRIAVAEVTFKAGEHADFRLLYRSMGWSQYDWDRLQPPDRTWPALPRPTRS